MVIRQTVAGLADLLWPPRCVACGLRLVPSNGAEEGSSFCDDCSGALVEVSSPMCPRCGLPFEGAGPDHLCGECITSPPAFGQLVAVYQYGGPAADAVMRLKYGKRTHLAKPLGEMIHSVTMAISKVDLVVPVPLHPKRLRKRGFNQSVLLAIPIASALKARLETKSIKRIRDTDPQAGQSRDDRRENIKGAFSVTCKRRFNDKQVLLVDDVVTTGTTVREVAKVIMAAGAASVSVAAFARAG